jgi:hypothetical protein
MEIGLIALSMLGSVGLTLFLESIHPVLALLIVPVAVGFWRHEENEKKRILEKWEESIKEMEGTIESEMQRQKIAEKFGEVAAKWEALSDRFKALAEKQEREEAKNGQSALDP